MPATAAQGGGEEAAGGRVGGADHCLAGPCVPLGVEVTPLNCAAHWPHRDPSSFLGLRREKDGLRTPRPPGRPGTLERRARSILGIVAIRVVPACRSASTRRLHRSTNPAKRTRASRSQYPRVPGLSCARAPARRRDSQARARLIIVGSRLGPPSLYADQPRRARRSRSTAICFAESQVGAQHPTLTARSRRPARPGRAL